MEEIGKRKDREYLRSVGLWDEEKGIRRDDKEKEEEILRRLKDIYMGVEKTHPPPNENRTNSNTI